MGVLSASKPEAARAPPMESAECTPRHFQPARPAPFSAGHALLEQLQSKQYRGLDLSHVRISPDASTGVAVLYVTAEDGQKGTVICHGANGAVGDEEVRT